jgi:hypothetical protein|tara:strand:- start:3 stop:206 length:204 start_codon:yes stop_codon:yes gene_type:complete
MKKKIKGICPCDDCDKRNSCGDNATECAAVREWYVRDYFFPHTVGEKLKPMKFHPADRCGSYWIGKC